MEGVKRCDERRGGQMGRESKCVKRCVKERQVLKVGKDV